MCKICSVKYAASVWWSRLLLVTYKDGSVITFERSSATSSENTTSNKISEANEISREKLHPYWCYVGE